MKSLHLFYLLSLLVLTSCGQMKTNDSVVKAVSLLAPGNDSLSRALNYNEFQAIIDTLSTIRSSQPEKVVLIEHHCVSCYSVTNLKYLLLKFNTDGVLYGFKYSYQDSTWKVFRFQDLTGKRVDSIDFTIRTAVNSESSIQDDTLSTGDLVRYASFTKRGNTVIRVVPDAPEDLIGALLNIQMLNNLYL